MQLNGQTTRDSRAYVKNHLIYSFSKHAPNKFEQLQMIILHV